MAAVAMAHGINANLLRRWVHDAEMKPSTGVAPARVSAADAMAKPSFLPMSLPSAACAQGINIEVRRGATSITVTWPTTATAECAAWMRELLR